MSHVIPLQPAEQITILPNISWETFDHLLQDMGNQRGQRLTYTGGILEIMSPLGEHDNWIARTLETGETATLRQFRTWLRNSGAPQQESP